MLYFLDSFDHYATADIPGKWTSYNGNQPSIETGGRTANCVRTSFGLGSPSLLQKALTTQSTWIIGAATKLSLMPTTIAPFFRFLDNGTLQAELNVNPDGSLCVTRNSTVLGTSTIKMSSGAFYYIEFKIKFDNTVGTYEVRLNGTSILSATGQDTQVTANAFATLFTLGLAANAGISIYFDDFYMFDTTGTANNNFAGDVSVTAHLATAAGDLSQWTPSAGSNYQCIDDSTPNGDTDYVSDATAGDSDLYNFADLALPVTQVLGIQRLILARKDDAGTRTIKPLYKGGGTVYEGSAVSIPNGYAWFTDILETDPATGLQWTNSNVNSAQFGVKLES